MTPPLFLLSVALALNVLLTLAVLCFVVALWRRPMATKQLVDGYTVFPAPQGAPYEGEQPSWMLEELRRGAQKRDSNAKREPITDSGEQARIEARRQVEAEYQALVKAGMAEDL